MRLINADALREQLQNLAYDDWNQGASTSWADAYREMADMVEDTPTIEPVRMKGEWIPTHESALLSHPDSITYVCSECGHKIYTVYGFPLKTNYCPNCGADMRNDEDTPETI